MTFLLALISWIPQMLLFFWMRSRIYKEDAAFRSMCTRSLVAGFISTFGAVVVSAVLYISLMLSGLMKNAPFIGSAVYNIIVLAFSEELVKFLTLKILIRIYDYQYSWISICSFMTIIGIGFAVIENLVYAVSSNLITMLVSGITMGHAGYGYITGRFYGKSKKTGKKVYAIVGFMLTTLVHGLYDFGLDEKVLEINDDFALISVTLALVQLLTVISAIHFFSKQRNNELYTMPLENVRKIKER